MTDVRRVSLLAAVLWIALHLTEAVLNADQHRNPVILAIALVLAVVLAFASLAPLYSSHPAALDRRRGLMVVLGATAMTLCVHPYLTATGLGGYANWPLGEVGVVIAALVLRECVSCALAITAVVVVSNSVAVWATPGVGWMQALFLATPTMTWLLGALAIRMVLRRGAVLREAYERRGFTFADEERLRRAVREADEARREELRTRVEPLLLRVAGEGATSRLRTEARLAAEDLRDSLKARSLLNRSLRDQIADARARGVRVVVSSAPGADERAEPELVGRTRTMLERVLVESELGTTVSCRTTGQPAVSLLLLRAPTAREAARVRDVLEAELARTPHDAPVTALLEEYDGELLLELRRR